MESSLPHFLVVVLGFNRPLSLKRLLASLESVESVACKADLVVSLDGGGDPECAGVASGVRWSHGRSEVVVHQNRMGLKTHVETATDRVKDYDAVIVLEDDLSVSPWMLHYSVEAFRAYRHSNEIAQIALYSYRVDDFSGLPFFPLRGEYDNWFSRVPSSWGQFYTRAQWQDYRKWSVEGKPERENARLPVAVDDWKSSWKRDFFEYVSASRRWVVYPHVSLTTNHGEPGENYCDQASDLEVPLELVRRRYCFSGVSGPFGYYDECFEPDARSLTESIDTKEEFTVDLWGNKPMETIKTSYLLSTRICEDPISRYSTSLFPLEANIRLGVLPDSDLSISFGLTSDFRPESRASELALKHLPRGLAHEVWEKGVRDGWAEAESGLRYRIGDGIVSSASALADFLGLRRRR